MGFKKTQKLFNIPTTFLGTCVIMGDKTPEEAALAKLGRMREFSKDMELELVGYLLAMAQKYFDLIRQDVRMMAFQIAKKNV